MKLEQLIQILADFNASATLEARPLGNDKDLPFDLDIRGIACNSKEVSDNFIFAAIKGVCVNGNEFIGEAIDKGAKVILSQQPTDKILASFKGNAEGPLRLLNGQRDLSRVIFAQVNDVRRALARLAAEFYDNPSRKVRVIGITGTNGKTTVSYLIEAILKEARAHPAVIGTINYRFKGNITASKNTTPGPIELQSMFSKMVNQGADTIVMEVSSHALNQDRIEGIRFSCAIFTNLTQDHLDYHLDMENYFQAKLKLFRPIDPAAYVVLNNDDAYGKKIAKKVLAKVVTYGINNQAEVMAEDIRFDAKYTEFSLITRGRKVKFCSRLIGLHNVYNILAAAAWAINDGIDLPVMKSAIEKFNPVPGRLERIDCGRDFSVFIDYAHTEDALKNVISTLRPLAKGKIIVVFGCGGERDKTKRPRMGYIVSELADYAIIANDNPRSEDPCAIIEDIKKGIKKENYRVIADRQEAIKESLALAGPGDIVLIAGKGHENYQILKDGRHSFDDSKVAKECLADSDNVQYQ